MKHLILFILSISLGFASSHTVETFPEAFYNLTLPLPYKSMTLEETRTTIFVPERAYAVLEDTTPQITAVVGPIAPCIFIGIRNNRSGKAIIAHKHYSNNLQDFFEAANRELGAYEPQDLIAKLYTYDLNHSERPMKSEPFWDELEELLDEEEMDTIYSDTEEDPSLKDDHSDWTIEEIREKHNGRTQQEEVNFIKTQLMTAFQLTNESQVFTQLFKSDRHHDLGFYSLVEETVHTDSYLNVSNIAPIKENVPRNYSNLPLHVELRYQSYLFDTETLRIHLIDKYTSSYPDNEALEVALDTYNLLPFHKLNLFGVALLELLEQAENGHPHPSTLIRTYG